MAAILLLTTTQKAAQMRATLHAAGHNVFSLQEAAQVVVVLQHQPVDLAVLELDLLGAGTWSLIDQLRQQAPELLLLVCSTTQRRSEDIVAALEHGADSYLGEPIDPETLLAQIAALLRRTRSTTSGTVPQREAASVQVGTLTINRACRDVWIGQNDARNRILLNRSEFDVLYLLARNCDRVISSDELLTAVWGLDYHGDDGAVYTRIYQIRKKLAAHPDAPHIQNVARCGYRLVVTADDTAAKP